MKYSKQKNQYFGKNNPNYKKGKPHCPICNKELNYDHKFCRKHVPGQSKNKLIRLKIGKSNTGNLNGCYKHGLYCKDKKCITCNKHCSPGAIRCKSCSEHIKKLGKLNPNYVHGKGHLPYTKNFPKIRKIILEKNNYICQICSKKGNIIHHIDYNPQNNQHTNLITLCHKCHLKSNANRDYWYVYFRYIMEIK